MPAPVLNTLRPAAAGLALIVLALAGCAQQRTPGYYSAERDSTLGDARAQAQGRGTGHAPSQIQLGFGENAPKRQAGAPTAAEQADKAAIAATVRPLREAKTFLGTLPCLGGAPACPASRVTLTLAPNGQWRARSQPLEGGKASTDQGCWDVIGTEPWRIVLRAAKSETSRASLTFVNDNMLRVNTVNDLQPTLHYHLTRQPDVDGIDELNGAPAPECGA